MRKKKNGWQSKKLMTTKNYNGVYSVNSSGVVTIVASSGPFHLFLELLTIINFWIHASSNYLIRQRSNDLISQLYLPKISYRDTNRYDRGASIQQPIHVVINFVDLHHQHRVQC